MSYFVRGTLGIVWERGALKISVTPSTGFVTPGEATHAIAFRFPLPGKGKRGKAKLIPLTDKKFDCNTTGLKGHISGLVTIASQQKPIEIRIEQQGNPPSWELVSFVFPAA